MMSEPCSATLGQLSPHWNQLINELAIQINDAKTGVKLTATTGVGNEIIATFRGAVVRRAGRNQGEPVPAIRFRTIRDWETWLGYREVWVLSSSSSRRFTFSSSDLTVFFTKVGNEAFQQILRAEWSGPAKNELGWLFRPNDAAHPHWQIDIAETLRADADFEAARDLLRDAAPKEFDETEPSFPRDPPWYQLGRMHLASAMRPWIDLDIAHGPMDLRAVRAWVVNTVTLLNIELDRL
jgi:hypothetical protein